MNAPTPRTTPEEPLPRPIGLHGRVAVLSAMAGGVALGGVLVGGMTLGGLLSGHALFMNATALFVVGAVLGLAHGLVLGFLGRDDGVGRRRALGDLGRAAMWAVPGLSLAWLASVWVAMSVVAAYTGRMGAMIGVALGWVGAAVILGLAAVHVWRALGRAFARWPERRAGTLVVAASFAALLVIFLADRPELWGVRLRLTETGAILLAAGAAIWVVGPIVTVALRLAQQIPLPRRLAGLAPGRTAVADLAVGLVVGLVVGLLALPFAGPATAPAALGSVVVEVGQALVDEVLLRLFLMTAVAWVLVSRTKVSAPTAFAAAVGTTVAAQVLLYAPGALAIGFPSLTGTAAFLLAAVAVPALAFGVLFWRRGFASALVADAVAVVMVLVLAA